MWKLEAGERIVHWRDFRKTLDLLTLDDAIAEAAKFWQACPFVPYYLDIDCVENWPDPWSLIYDNTYCDIAKCLGIVYTMLLTAHRKNLEIEVRHYVDTKNGYEYNLAWINQGKYVLNLIDGEIVNSRQINKTLTLVKQYTAKELQLDNY
jgi:hypothetical protein